MESPPGPLAYFDKPPGTHTTVSTSGTAPTDNSKRGQCSCPSRPMHGPPSLQEMLGGSLSRRETASLALAALTLTGFISKVGEVRLMNRANTQLSEALTGAIHNCGYHPSWGQGSELMQAPLVQHNAATVGTELVPPFSSSATPTQASALDQLHIPPTQRPSILDYLQDAARANPDALDQEARTLPTENDDGLTAESSTAGPSKLRTVVRSTATTAASDGA